MIIEKSVLDLIKRYPNYGPKALKYLLEELDFNISESAVYNILKRNNLTRKEQRKVFSQKSEKKEVKKLPPLSHLKSGECWIFWITDLGILNNVQTYTYNIFDLKSRISCSRIYQEINFNNFEDIFTAVALAVATTLDLNLTYLCFFNENTIQRKTGSLIKRHGRHIKIHILNNSDELTTINKFKNDYTEKLHSEMTQSVIDKVPLQQLKSNLQKFIRSYNMEMECMIDGEKITPIEYHKKITKSKAILPLWAYINREY